MCGKTNKTVCLALLLSMIALCSIGCSAGSNSPDITSKWKIKEFTVNGKTTKVDETPFLVSVFTAKANPKFSCKDGVNCVFSLLDKTYTGTVTQEGDIYIIDFNNKKKNLYGMVVGNNLILENEEETLELVFETK